MEIQSIYRLFQKHPNISCDTRHPSENSIFFALRSANTKNKGNQYAKQAIEESGSHYAIIDDPILKEKFKNDKRYILVNDTLETLQKLAQHHREKINIPILAVAGSNGKTTTKELLKLVLGRGYRVGATYKNLNNQIGVPLTLLNLTENHDIGIIEIGANHLYETAQLCTIAKPNYGLITNCGKDHLEGYISTQNVIQANTELYDYLRNNNGIAFINSEDDILVKHSKGIKNRFFYGNGKPHPLVKGYCLNSAWLKAKIHIPNSPYPIDLCVTAKLFGRYWLSALVSTFAIGRYFGITPFEIRNAIESYQPIGLLRSEVIQWRNNEVILDCYNANPSSMEVFIKEAISFYSEYEKVFVLGTMLEGGSTSVEEHKAIINLLIENEIQNVIIVDDKKEKIFAEALKCINHKYSYFADIERAKLFVNTHFGEKNMQYFVKGSNRVNLPYLFNYKP